MYTFRLFVTGSGENKYVTGVSIVSWEESLRERVRPVVLDLRLIFKSEVGTRGSSGAESLRGSGKE